MKKKFAGVIPAIASPCDKNGIFLEGSFRALTEYIFSYDVQGLYVCGATGDFKNLTVAERMCAVEIAIDCAKGKDKVIIVHVAADKIEDAQALAVHAAKSGADAVSSVPPCGSSEEIKEYYERIASAAGIPVFIYNIPALIGRTPTVEKVAELLNIPGVIGLKHSDTNMFFIRRLRNVHPDAVVLNGYDEMLTASLIYGADGGVGMWYNLFPYIFSDIYKAVKCSDVSRAMELQNAFLDLSDLGWSYGMLEIFEILMEKSGLAPKCFRKVAAIAPELLNKIGSVLDERLARLQNTYIKVCK